MSYYLSSDTILDRVAVCCAEIAGIVRVYRYVPTVPTIDLPCIQIEGMDRTSSRTSEAWARTIRTVSGVCLVGNSTSLDSSDGSYILSVGEPFEDAIESYFLSHPYLETTAGLSGLGLLEPITVNVSHAEIGTLQGGAPILKIDFEIILQLDRAV